MRFAAKFQENENSSQVSLFGDASEVQIPEPEVPPCEEWGTMKKLKAFKKLHGHTRVPTKRGTCNVLGRWVMRQRSSNTNGKLRQDRKTLLDQIAFSWGVSGNSTIQTAQQRQPISSESVIISGILQHLSHATAQQIQELNTQIDGNITIKQQDNWREFLETIDHKTNTSKL